MKPAQRAESCGHRRCPLRHRHSSSPSWLFGHPGRGPRCFRRPPWAGIDRPSSVFGVVRLDGVPGCRLRRLWDCPGGMDAPWRTTWNRVRNNGRRPAVGFIPTRARPVNTLGTPARSRYGMELMAPARARDARRLALAGANRRRLAHPAAPRDRRTSRWSRHDSSPLPRTTRPGSYVVRDTGGQAFVTNYPPLNALSS